MTLKELWDITFGLMLDNKDVDFEVIKAHGDREVKSVEPEQIQVNGIWLPRIKVTLVENEYEE